MRKIIIYYFSGTGNSEHVARWIKKIAIEKNIAIELFNLSKMEKRKASKPEPDTMVGFISPTHGFNFPPIMFHFLLRYPRVKKCSAFIINTRAGVKMGKKFLPGLSGLAQPLSALILKLKGFKIQGMHPIDLPSNWISVHPGIKQHVSDSIYAHRKKEVEIFASRIVEGKKDLKAFRDIIQDLLISPISIAYYIVGRFFLAKTFIASHQCTDCGLCEKTCPVGAIKKTEGRMFWKYTCESCMRCMNKCPERAIHTAHGMAVGLWIIIDIVLMAYLYRVSSIDDYLEANLSHGLYGLIDFLIFSFILLFGIILGYRIMHFLMRFKLFERLIILTSLTNYKFWRRFNYPNKEIR